MMCLISKKRIAFCAQVEGTHGEVFAASPIALQSWCKRVPTAPIPMYGHSWPSTPEYSFKIGDRQSVKKRWHCDRRVICNATRGIGAGRGVILHRDVSDGSDGPRPLWWSHSTRMELFFADAIFYAFRIVTTSYFSAPYDNWYIIWEKLMCMELAELSNYYHSEIHLMISQWTSLDNLSLYKLKQTADMKLVAYCSDLIRYYYNIVYRIHLKLGCRTMVYNFTVLHQLKVWVLIAR
jgi:hypothetical protein